MEWNISEENVPSRILYAYVRDPTDVTNEDSSTEESGLQPPTPPPYPRRRWFLLEFPVFMVFWAMFLSNGVFQNQILYQTCTAIYNYNSTQCQPLLGMNRESAETQRIETEIQPYVADIFMAKSLLESIFPAMISLFIGPWSDKYGRRPVLLATFVGYLCHYIMLSVFAWISTLTTFSPWFYLICSIPSIISGGICALITGIYCYISDVAKEKATAIRMVFNEAAIYGGIMIGSLSCSYIYDLTNTTDIFIISSILVASALLYIQFNVPESLILQEVEFKLKIREFFRLDLVKDLLQTCFKGRPNYDRIIIWLSISALALSIFAFDGEGNVVYLFLREKFDCTLKDYNLMTTASIIIQITGSLIGMLVFRKIFKLSIISVALVAFGSCVLESTVRATAIYWWQIYFGFAVGLMRGLMDPMIRSVLSHVTPANEVGKIFAFTTSLESLSPLVASPLYTTVYDNTLTYYPGAFNFISVGLFTIGYIFIAIIFGILKFIGTTYTYQAISS